MLLVFGSLNADLAFYVDVLPQPGETRLCGGYTLGAGGKGGNQALAAALAGASVAMVGAVGNDTFAGVALEQLRRAGVDVDRVRVVGLPTACASIWVDSAGENMIVVGSGANASLRGDHIDDALLQSGSTLVVQMEVSEAATWAVVRRAHARGCRTVVNLAPARDIPPDAWASIDVLVLNSGEAATLAAREGLEGRPALEIAQGLAQRHHLTCIVTLGGDGCVAAWPGGQLRVPALAVNVVDTTGAGDAFVGVLAARLQLGDSLLEALRSAAAASGLACAHPGTQPSLPRLEAIAQAVEQLPAA